MAKKKEFDGFNSPVTFSGVSIGDKTTRIGMAIDKKQINLAMADQLFCDRRLTGKIVLGVVDEAENQQKLDGMDDTDHEVAGSFDVKGFRVNSDVIAIGATFAKQEIDIEELARFAKGKGRLVIDNAGEIPVIPKEPPVTMKGKVPDTLKLTGPARDVPVDDLFSASVVEKLAGANIDTVGKLADWTASGRLLTDIDGIGEKKADDIQETMVDFWAKFPNEAEDKKAAKAAAKASA
jgi:hypothetical protein